jgi:SAM-dependent methyltransferase
MSNILQKEMWNGRAGESWVRHNSLLEQLLAEPGRECMNLLPLTPAMQILDVGCGCGNQTLELAARLDASSTVIGVDISEPMLGLARELKAANDNALSAEVQFALGDASEPLFDEASFDAIYSRFGVMFFEEPVAAFSALRNSLKPGGKLGFVCWREPKLNPFFNAPMEAALTVLPAPASSAPGAPGPFGLADDNVIQTTLRLAGFKDVSVVPLNLTLSVGAETPFDAVFEELIQIGPAAALIAQSDPSLKEKAREAVYNRLTDFYASGQGVSFDANFWLVTARN